MDLRAFFDICGKVAFGGDGEGFATMFTVQLNRDSSKRSEMGSSV
jgi:hypothetical protein